MVSGSLSTASYNYDIANRLTDVNGVLYTWDDNGNLRNDGVNTYGYDSANRLKTLTGPSVAANYAYRCNGESIGQFGCESDRVSQTVNGMTTSYVLDSASVLTQVLQDGTNTYVYGVDRIAQVNGAAPDYFLTDGLGSVRQLVDSSGLVTLAKSYQPYGTEASYVGSGYSNYGFTGEMTDPTGLTYLRARYYASETGRFITKDSWAGDYNKPLSLNHWNYVEANPVNYTDPSGHISCKDIISSWRPVFIALHLCNPQEEPTLTEREIESFESFNDTLNGNFVTCGVGYISYGYICVPATVEKTLGGYCGENTTGAFLTTNKDDERGEEQLQEKCERYRQEYEATIREINFRISLIRQYQNVMASTDDPEVRETMAGLILNTQYQADLFYAGARMLLFQAIEEGCNASLWSPLPILPWV